MNQVELLVYKYSNRLIQTFARATDSLPRIGWPVLDLRCRMLWFCLLLVLTVGLGNMGWRWLRVQPDRLFAMIDRPVTHKKTRPVRPIATRPIATQVRRTRIPLTSTSVIRYGKQLNRLRFGNQHWGALYSLWWNESGWNPAAYNSSSGACGIPQALPCSKIPDHSPAGQIRWGLDYIRARYNTPTNAWLFWQNHHWY